MKFGAFKEYRGNVDQFLEDPKVLMRGIVQYLSVDLVKSLRELQGGLSKLDLNNNFIGFVETLTIPAGVEAEIINRLAPEIPSYKLIVRGKDGAQNVVDGDTDWNKELLYLKNVGASSATVTVLFLR